jgi:aminoglycoside phosphotransferase (APT) family kinase protein
MVGIDPAAVGAWIATLGLGARPPFRYERIGNGLSNLTYLVTDADERRWVLRRPPLGELLTSAHDVAREHTILAALGPAGMPVPAVLGLSRGPTVSDVPLLLMEHVDGLVIDSAGAAAQVSTDLRAPVALSLPATLAQIHSADPEAIGLGELSTSTTPYARRQLRRWRGQWEESGTGAVPLIDELADRLAAAVPEQRETTIVHGDFHLLNAILSPRSGAVRAVIDWELCTLGDPISDLGSLLAYWTAPGELRRPVQSFSALPGVPPRGSLASAYGEASGRSLDSLDFWHTLGLWKIAIIVAGVIRRAEEEPGNLSPATPAPALVEELAEQAALVAARAGL